MLDTALPLWCPDPVDEPPWGPVWAEPPAELYEPTPEEYHAAEECFGYPEDALIEGEPIPWPEEPPEFWEPDAEEYLLSVRPPDPMDLWEPVPVPA